jgi:Rieske Fe-S protein
VFLGVGAAGAATVLAACGDEPATSRQPAPATTAADTDGGSTPPDLTAEGGVSIPIAFVPVGGGYIDFKRGVIVTQPEAGHFRAFEANCTHMRCFITWVADGLIQCPCHGSQFRISDGSVVKGPATRSLDTRAVTVSGDIVVVS